VESTPGNIITAKIPHKSPFKKTVYKHTYKKCFFKIVFYFMFLRGVQDEISYQKHFRAVFLNRRAAARYRVLTSIIPGRERPEEIIVCYKISLVQLITNLNIFLYLSTCNTIYISALILFMIML
jgi:hypothetical protein